MMEDERAVRTCIYCDRLLTPDNAFVFCFDFDKDEETDNECAEYWGLKRKEW